MSVVCFVSSLVVVSTILSPTEHCHQRFPTRNFFRHNVAAVPQIYHFGQEGLHNFLVIDLLGPSLEDLFDICGRRFSIKTVCMAARQMVRVTLCLRRLFQFRFLDPSGSRDLSVSRLTSI